MKPARPEQHWEIERDDLRITFRHQPSGRAIFRPTSLEGPQCQVWLDRFAAKLALHSDTHLVYDRYGRVEADARDFPATGGGFDVGDLVVLTDGSGRTSALKVVGSFEWGPRTNREADVAPLAYVLENGRTLRYSQMDVAWEASAHVGVVKARRVLPSEDAVALRRPLPATLAEACDVASETLRHATRNNPCWSTRLEEAEAAREALSLLEADVEEFPTDENVAKAYEAIVAARDLLGTVARIGREDLPEDTRARDSDARLLLKLDGVIEAAAERGAAPQPTAPRI